MELKKGQKVHIGNAVYVGSIPDDVAIKIGLKKVKKEKSNNEFKINS